VIREPGVTDRLVGRAAGGYEDRTVLEPWQGYWVHSAAASPVTITIPGTQLAAATKAPRALPAAPPPALALAISAERGARWDRDNVAAVAASGLADLPEPPALAGDLRVCFVAEDRELSRDVRPGLGEGQRWDLCVSGDPGEEPVRLSVAGVADLPADVAARLMSEDGVLDLDLRATPEAEFRLGWNGETRLVLGVGEAGFVERLEREAAPPPARTALHPGFPNPFNAKITLRYTLREAGRARLTIYDVAGRRVRILVDENLPDGEHWVNWYGKDDRGRNAASGVYFVRMKAGDHEETRRLALVR
jgi:hypothetical protein